MLSYLRDDLGTGCDRLERVDPVHQHVGKDNLRRNGSEAAFEGNLLAGSKFTLEHVVDIFTAEEGIPPSDAFGTLAVDERRSAEPDDLASRLGELLKKVQEALAGKGLEHDGDRVVLLGRDMHPAVVPDGAHLDKLFRRQVVGVAVLGHPAAETLLHGDEVHRIDHEDLDVTVHASGHQAHHRVRTGPVGVVEHHLPVKGRGREAPGCGVGVGVLVDHSDGRTHGCAVVVPVAPSALGEIVAGGLEILAPLEVVVACSAGLVDRVAPDIIGSVVVLGCIFGQLLGVVEVDRGTLGP